MSEQNEPVCCGGPNRMNIRNNARKSIYGGTALLTGLTGIGLMLGTAGCGRSESPPAAAGAAQNGAKGVPYGVDAPAAMPVPAVPADAPVMADAYPLLASGVLTHARLTDLEPGVLLRSEGVRITESDLNEELAGIPPAFREQMEKNRIFMLDQRATEALIKVEALKASPGASAGDPMLLQGFMEAKVAGVGVTAEEEKRFYDENREMVGDAPFDQIAPRIRQHLIQQKQQEALGHYIRDLGRQRVIALSGDWVKSQAVSAMDNPVDKARTSGSPTVASFGADSCMPCQMMKPIREAVAGKYGERLNVVYVHVNKDPVLAQRYGVQGIPFMIFFDAEGQKIHEQAGMMSEAQIEEWLVKSGAAL